MLTWSVILLFVPFFGLILYLFLGFGPHFGAKKKFLTKFSDDKKFQQLVGQQRDALDASAFREEIKELARFNLDSNSLFSVDNEAQVFTDVGEFYEDMLREIEKAKSFIHAEFYYMDDESGRIRKCPSPKAFKTLLVDDDISSIGTFNIDTRSFKLQFEVTIFIYDKGFGKQLEKVFMEDLKQSAQLDSFYQSSKSWGRLAKERFMKLLTPLL